MAEAVPRAQSTDPGGEGAGSQKAGAGHTPLESGPTSQLRAQSTGPHSEQGWGPGKWGQVTPQGPELQAPRVRPPGRRQDTGCTWVLM